MYSGWATSESMTRLAYQRDEEQASEAVSHALRVRGSPEALTRMRS